MTKDFYDNKRAMSAIVTTVIIVALALVAIGIVWAVVNNILNESSGDIELSQKCVDSVISATSAQCNAGAECNITLERTSGEVEIAGVKLTFSNSSTTGSAQDISGNIEEFGTKTITDSTLTDVGAQNANSVKIRVYFEDESGIQQSCPGSTTYNF